MKKRTLIKAEYFLIAHTVATLSIFVAFLCSWGIPVHSVIKARKTYKKNKTPFCDEVVNTYNNSVAALAGVPANVYDILKEKGKMRLKQFDEKQR